MSPLVLAVESQSDRGDILADNATNSEIAPPTSPTTNADVLKQVENYNQLNDNLDSDDRMGQITNASQFRDVSPTDWAYEALDRVVQKYGCLVGYPDGTYRGNRALSRYQFAAGLNACLRQIEALIEAQGQNYVSQEDFESLQKLVEEFRTELTTLNGRVDNLESRTAFLEAHQFSTTTKLTGEVIFGIADAFGGDAEEIPTVFHDRVRLNLLTSFTGKDRLRTRLQAGNAVPLLTSSTLTPDRRTNEGRFTYDGSNDNKNDNDILIDILDYRFPVGDNLAVTVFANGALHHYYADTVNPYFEGFAGGNNALSRFAERNPIYRLGPLSAGVGVNYKINDFIKFDLGYLSNTANNANAGGLFNGNYSALAQLVVGNKFKVGLTYIHAFENNAGANALVFGGTGTNLANLNQGALAAVTGLPANTFDRAVVSDSYGIQASLQFSPKFVLNGWVGKTDARLIGLGDADIWNFAVALAFPDLGKKGNLGGILVGAEPTLRGLDVPGTQNFTRDFAYHIEGFYKYQLTNNISITPGIIWLTSPNQNSNNNDVIIGTLRTTFTF
jgi:BMFP domain-containing protein YqiC